MNLISPTYMALQKQLHAEMPHYGVSGARYTDIVRSISEWGRLGILDYGCGKQTLAQALGPAYRVTNYDPCISGLDTPPQPHDVVACTDVMEHVEPEFLHDTLCEIRRLTQMAAFFVISIAPAQKVLADGRNAHISLHPVSTWIQMLTAAGFECGDKFDDDGDYNTFGVVCR